MEKFNGSLNVEEVKTPPQNKENSSKITMVEGTPFAIVERKDNDYIVIFGSNMITERSFYTIEEAKTWISLTDWLPILNVIGIYVEHTLNSKNK